MILSRKSINHGENCMRFNIKLEDAIKNSFCDYHTKGLDYLCLNRDSISIEKLYFINTLAAGKQLVIPHDHRYDFFQQVIKGRCSNQIFSEGGNNNLWHRFLYDTPLNGGNGFKYDKRVSLYMVSDTSYKINERWFQHAEKIHTLVCDEGTILFSVQFKDKIEGFTKAYSLKNELPDLSGLYSRMSEDKIWNYIETIINLGHIVQIT